MSDEILPTTSVLASGVTVIFDVPHDEADDHDDTHLAYEILAAAVGK